MESDIINLLNISNIIQTSIFFVCFVLSISHKRNIDNRKLCYAIGVALNTLQFILLIFIRLGDDHRTEFVICECVDIVVDIIFILIVNGDRIWHKLWVIVVAIVPVRVIEAILIIYFGNVLGTSIFEDGNSYIAKVFIIFFMSVTIEYYAISVMFIEGRQLRNEMGVILMIFLFPLMGFMDMSFMLGSNPGGVGPVHVIFVSMQLTVIAAVSFALLRFVNKSLVIIEKEREQVELERLRSMDSMYYDVVQADVEFVRKFRHDAANYIEQIEFMIDHLDDKSESVLRSMVEDLKDRTRSINARVYSSDPLTNVILTLKAKKCSDLNIGFNVKINLPEGFDPACIEPLDRSSILSNLIDNAIDSSVLCKEKGMTPDINVSIGMIGDYLAMRIENCTVHDGEINDVKSLMRQINENRKNSGHGYGLIIVQEKAAKYGGDVVVNVKNNKCLTVVTVRIDKEEGITNV